MTKQSQKLRFLAVLLPFVLLSGFNLINAQGAGDLFRKANDAYTRGDFTTAQQLYERIMHEEDVISPEIYYNLGNTYYRLGKSGKAFLYWERTLKIVPRDKDTRFNITFVRSRLFAEEEEKKALEIVIGWLQRLPTLNEMAIIGAVMYCAGMLCIIGYLFFKQPVLLKSVIVSGIILVICCAWMFILYQYHISLRRGIVVVPTVEVHNGPDESFKVGFTAVEGSETVLLRESGEWQEIGISRRGLKGWVKKEMVEAI